MNTDWLPYAFAVGLASVHILRHRRFVEIKLFGLFKIRFGDDPLDGVKKEE